MAGANAQSEITLDADAACARLSAMATFRDGEVSRRQIGTQLDALHADFARCLAMSGWAIARPLRLIVFGLPMQASLDECLLACLQDAGHAFGGLDAAMLAACLDSRWEFVRGNEVSPARYRPGPSYHERLRVDLLLDAWDRASRRADVGYETIETLARDLATASAALSSRLALPYALLRRAAAERRIDSDAELRLQRHVRKGLVELAMGDIRHLAITAALDGGGDVAATVQRYGTASMRVLLRAHIERSPPTSARAALAPRLARLRRELWTSLSAHGQA
jgi:hypothetical protein